MDTTTKKMVEDLDYIIKKAKGNIDNGYESVPAETIRSATFTKATVLEMMAKIKNEDKVPDGGAD